MIKKYIILFCFPFFFLAITYSQDSIHIKKNKTDTISFSSENYNIKNNIDFVDVFRKIFVKNAAPRKDTGNVKTGKLHASVLPAAQYTLQTGIAFSIVANAAFYTSNDSAANISSILTSVNYTQKNQFFMPIQGNFWTKGNKINILTDWHFEKYPQPTYGLGGYTKLDNGYNINYTYIRMYQTFLKTIRPDLYVGIGYNLDYYWNIEETNPPVGVVTDFEKYGLSTTSVASGFTFNFLYDKRRNSINPNNGAYVNISLRENTTFLGSNNNWSSLLIDARKYFQLSNTNTILALWTYNWFTVSGKAPYLNLANTACDTYLNMGRGYIQGRYRGQNLLYLESELRFKILKNGLIGGIVFANAQSYTEPVTNKFQTISPACGVGLRFKLNKFSKTNIAFDWGYSKDGLVGPFFNLGEVF